LNNLQHQPQASQLLCADALFLPDAARLAALSDNQRLKLAFVLHTVYAAHDVAAQLLAAIDSDLAAQYLKHHQNPCAKVEPPRAPMQEPQVTFPADVAAYVERLYTQASVILEYGSGGSTLLAAKLPDKRVISVENDARWAEDMQAWIANASLPSRPRIYPVDVGETGKWARPKNARHWKKFHTYPLRVWDEPFFEQPDVILIDGRFRIACFVTAYLRTSKPVIVLFDDYLDRPHYHVVERLLKPSEYVGRMARFDLQPLTELPRGELTWLVASFNEVAYADG
jgi:hypothetical protein